jgi:radical SAM protein with 4Fe4S-binding SPASM domain
MKEHSSFRFYNRLYNKKKLSPVSGMIELTYRCGLDCVHCYCKGSEDKQRELSTAEWKKVLDQAHKEGCVNITFTGGDPLFRKDFLELYSYAKAKGFLITIFTNGALFTRKLIGHLKISPPYSIEITLNGITRKTYEAVTQTPGSFKNAMRAINALKKAKLPLKLKTNCLRQNKDEVMLVKAFTEKLLGKPEEMPRYRFKFDPMISPRLNRDLVPTNYRISFEELEELCSRDSDVWNEYKNSLRRTNAEIARKRIFLYRCNSWMKQFFINPYGRLKFCEFSDKFSVDLRTARFRDGFYDIFPRVLKEKFKSDSKCRNCPERSVCYTCPSRAYLETGDEEAPVPYFCELAKKTAKRVRQNEAKL